MPEMPDIEAYRIALEREIAGRTLHNVDILHPFLLRSVSVPPEEAVSHTLRSVHRLGKRIALAFDNDIWFVFHLMIAGRLKWKPATDGRAGEDQKGRGRDDLAQRSGSAVPRRSKSGPLAVLTFASGVLSLTEAGSKRRASLHVVRGEDEAQALSPGGLEILDDAMTSGAFAEALRRENHTLKRCLTDPRLFSGIGNSYSDEILFAARLSPFAMSQSVSDEEIARLFEATRTTLGEWRDRLVAEATVRFPTKVTAFRPEMHVHGKFNQPCDVCGTPVQRIRYAENECNYCPTCQTGGKVYADRALSRLLKSDWPRTVEELEKLGRPPGS